MVGRHRLLEDELTNGNKRSTEWFGEWAVPVD